MRYTIPVETARAAVRPTPLVDVLRSLRDAKLITAFEITGEDLQIDADPGAELAFVLEAETTDPRLTDGALRSAPLPTRIEDESWTEPHARLNTRHAGHLREETAGAYFRQAEAFTHTAAFRRLSRHRRAVWRLHAQGKSKYEIADELSCPSGSVARAILAIRPQAGLGRTARSIPRGPQNRKTS